MHSLEPSAHSSISAQFVPSPRNPVNQGFNRVEVITYKMFLIGNITNRLHKRIQNFREYRYTASSHDNHLNHLHTRWCYCMQCHLRRNLDNKIHTMNFQPGTSELRLWNIQLVAQDQDLCYSCSWNWTQNFHTWPLHDSCVEKQSCIHQCPDRQLQFRCSQRGRHSRILHACSHNRRQHDNYAFLMRSLTFSEKQRPIQHAVLVPFGLA